MDEFADGFLACRNYVFMHLQVIMNLVFYEALPSALLTYSFDADDYYE
jgi:hypothetical protein